MSLRDKIAEAERMVDDGVSEASVIRDAFALLLGFAMSWKPVELVRRAGREEEKATELKIFAPYLGALCRCFEPLAEGICGLEAAEAKELEGCLRHLAALAAAAEKRPGFRDTMVMLEEVFVSPVDGKPMGLKNGAGLPLHTLAAMAAGLGRKAGRTARSGGTAPDFLLYSVKTAFHLAKAARSDSRPVSVRE